MIESWAARDHTLVPVGGGVLQVDLRRKTEVDIDAGVARCDDGDFERLVRQIVLEAEMRGEEVDIDRVREEVHRRFQSCQRVIARLHKSQPA